MLEWKRAISKKDKDSDYFKIPKNWLFVYHYEALVILFRIENALRVFVYTILKNKFKEEWLNQSVTSDDSEEGTINSIAKKRLRQADNFGYLGYTILCPMMHLTSGELIRLIFSDAYWQFFKSYFPGARDIMKNKLEEIGTIRNSLAHFRPIKNDDIELIKQNSKHVLMKIDKYISEMFSCDKIVPTNTTDDWYKNLSTIKETNICKLSFLQSSDEKWIQIKFIYNCPIINYRKLGVDEDMVIYQILNIDSPNLLKLNNDLLNFITFMSEKIPRVNMPDNLIPSFKKELRLTFSKKIL